MLKDSGMKTVKCRICGKIIEETDYFWLGYEEKVNNLLESKIVSYKICADHYREGIMFWNELYSYQETSQINGKIIIPTF